MNPLQHAYEATFEELLQLVAALTEPGELQITNAGTIRRRIKYEGYSTFACPLCTAFNAVFQTTGCQYPAQQLRMQVANDGLLDGRRYWGAVRLIGSGCKTAEGWRQFIAAADNHASTPAEIARRDLMREVLCSS